MGVGRAGFAIGTEVKVVTDGALVTGATNVRRISLGHRAKRSITADAQMYRLNNRACLDVGQWLVDGSEAVARVHKVRAADAVCAIVPVGAVEALVANTGDVLGSVSG